MTTQQTPDLTTIKGRQQKAWSSGDYGKVGVTLLMMAEHLAEAADLQPGHRVIDVASGNGNAALAAARRFADVTAIDYVPMLLEEGRKRAEAEGLAIDFVEGDAENLPFPDGSFDSVINVESSFCYPSLDAFFAEVRRVLRPGGHLHYTDLRLAHELIDWRTAIARSELEIVSERDAGCLIWIAPDG